MMELMNPFSKLGFSEKSAVGHSIAWLHHFSAEQVHIGGATTFAVSGEEGRKIISCDDLFKLPCLSQIPASQFG
ncbi:hypothetical protein L6164_031395 [Bauhinia variegata]|uniref:Uncharacterized protein n=1 Tax=Bauhinia variegata TaxID=167791 RepID=A0ACB9LGN3_BAUVA|nr:hypothetical protein L6164_031395 [Bauhinia variegata]